MTICQDLAGTRESREVDPDLRTGVEGQEGQDRVQGISLGITEEKTEDQDPNQVKGKMNRKRRKLAKQEDGSL